MQNFRELKVWVKAMELNKSIYKASAKFPDSEKYGITSQLRRACVSIPANIAEGCGHSTIPQFIKFLNISLASAYEVECLVQICFDIELFGHDEINEFSSKVIEIKKMLVGLINRVGGDQPPSSNSAD